MIRINDIIDKISEYDPDTDLDVIERAYVYSARVHEGQVRLSGEPYLSHPLEVAGILADMKLDLESPYCMLDGHRIIPDDEGCDNHHYDVEFKHRYENIDEIQVEFNEAVEKARKQRKDSRYDIS